MKAEEIRNNIQDNLEDYTLKTEQELINMIIDFGCGELEFHTADIELLIKINQSQQRELDNMLKSYSKCISLTLSRKKKIDELEEIAERFIEIQERTNGDIGTETYQRFKKLLTK